MPIWVILEFVNAGYPSMVCIRVAERTALLGGPPHGSVRAACRCISTVMPDRNIHIRSVGVWPLVLAVSKQSQCERTATTAAEIDAPAVGLDDFSGNGQSQSGAGGAFFAWHAEKFLEDFLGIFGGNARPGIGNSEHNLVGVRALLDADAHDPAHRGEFQRVRQKISERKPNG